MVNNWEKAFGILPYGIPVSFEGMDWQTDYAFRSGYLTASFLRCWSECHLGQTTDGVINVGIWTFKRQL